jgi:hypothetical protein
MVAGHRVRRASLGESRGLAQRELAALPERCRALEPAAPPYPVRLSPGLEAELRSLRRSLAGPGAPERRV